MTVVAESLMLHNSTADHTLKWGLHCSGLQDRISCISPKKSYFLKAWAVHKCFTVKNLYLFQVVVPWCSVHRVSVPLPVCTSALKARFWPLTQTCSEPIKSRKVILWVGASWFQSKFAQLGSRSGTQSSLRPDTHDQFKESPFSFFFCFNLCNCHIYRVKHHLSPSWSRSRRLCGYLVIVSSHHNAWMRWPMQI